VGGKLGGMARGAGGGGGGGGVGAGGFLCNRLGPTRHRGAKKGEKHIAGVNN